MRFDIQRFLDLGSTSTNVNVGNATYIKFDDLMQFRNFKKQLMEYAPWVSTQLMSEKTWGLFVYRYDTELHRICRGTSPVSLPFRLGRIIHASEFGLYMYNTGDLLDFLDS